MQTISKLRVKPNKITIYNSCCYTKLWEELSYRTTKQITQIRIRSVNDGYAVCPNCYRSLEREYMDFCNNCGQKIGWDAYNLFNIRTILLNNKTNIKIIILSEK